MDEFKHPEKNVKPDRIPDILPILPIADISLFPKMVLPMILVQKEAIELIDVAMAKNRMLGLLLSKRPNSDLQHTSEDLYQVGIAAVILKMSKMEDDKTQILLRGMNRFKVIKFIRSKKYIQAKIQILTDRNAGKKSNQNLIVNIIKQYERFVSLSTGIPSETTHMIKSLQEPSTLADMITPTINVSAKEKQKLIALLDVNKRLEKIGQLVNDQIESLEMDSQIKSQVKKDMYKRQREYYLRQQLKTIKEQLDEKEDENVEIKEYRININKKKLPKEAQKEANRELQRLSKMHPSSSEYVVALTYLDWLTALPWNDSSKDKLDISNARKILDKDHFGLEKPKKRILEYLAVRNLKKNPKGPILCFAGPPGTGKTSLGKSIARALDKPFVRIALGGLRDEAEIRGHRRTYVGALPGRIIQNLRKAGKNNPVFMLDEIDKLHSSYQGNPASALLEVLDPEQNCFFSDHYLDVSFDLSNVMFLTTANVVHTIPDPLQDRMEILKLNGYTQEEKIKIANRYLIPKQRKANGLKASQIKITAGAVKKIISEYTKESGLRNLERQIGAVCRRIASHIVEKKAKRFVVRQKDIYDYLGPALHRPGLAFGTRKPGVVVGLAWTPYGGEILLIEAVAIKGGKGQLTLTGQLGDIMKESARTALSFVLVNIKKERSFFNNNDFHIHVPEGSIPKDGPSAGLSMLVSLASLSTGRLVKKHLAMSGEITLRGELLPVAGIKEKIIAAHRTGIKTIILPSWNQKDTKDMPDYIKDSIEFIFTDKMEEALELALD